MNPDITLPDLLELDDYEFNKSSGKCIAKDCIKTGTFNYPPKDGVYLFNRFILCKKHKMPGMINTKSSKCVACKERQPIYNFYDDTIEKTKALYCGKCKLPEMIDVRNNKCLSCGERQGFYNYPGLYGRYCVECAEEGMVYASLNKCPDCDDNKLALYNYPDQNKGIYCAIHCKDGMVNVFGNTCKTEGCRTLVLCREKYERFCYTCYFATYPDKEPIRYQKYKENAVCDFVRREFPDYNIKWDSIVGKSKKRPDIFIKLENFNLIVENDEYQHREQFLRDIERDKEIHEDLKKDPTAILRFNPDQFYDDNGNFVCSCWLNCNRRMEPYIADEKIWKHRLQLLKRRIQYYIDNPVSQGLYVEYLFYDGFCAAKFE